MKNLMFSMLIFLSAVTVYSIEPVLLWRQPGQESKVISMVYSHDGANIFIQKFSRTGAKAEYILEMWDINNKKLIKSIACTKEFNLMDISPDDKTIVGASNKSFLIEIVNIESGTTSIFSDIESDLFYPGIFALSFSDKNNLIYVYEYANKYLQVIDIKIPQRLSPVYMDKDFQHTSFSDDGRYTVNTHSDSTLTIWNLQTVSKMFTLKIPSPRNSTFINDKYLIVTYDSLYVEENVEIYSSQTGELLDKFKSGVRLPCSYMAFSNFTLITVPYPSGMLQTFDLSTHEKTNYDMEFNASAFFVSPFHVQIASCDKLQDIIIYNLITDSIKLKIESIETKNLSSGTKVRILADKNLVLVSGNRNSKPLSGGKINAYNLNDGSYLKTYDFSNSNITDFAISKDGKILAASDYNGSIYISENFDTGQEFEFKTYGNFKNINSIAISDDNKKLFGMGSNSGLIYINLETKNVKTYSMIDQNVNSIALNSNGTKLIAAGSNKYISVVKYNESNDGIEVINSFLADSSIGKPTLGIMHIEFSKDEKYIICASSDFYTYIFDAETYEKISSFKAQSGWSANCTVTASLSSNNKYIFNSDYYPTLRIYDFKSGYQEWYNDNLELYGGNIIKSIDLGGEDKYLAYCGTDGTVALYDVSSFTSVNEYISGSEIIIYPNPATDFIEIRKPSEGITIYNTLGKIVWQELINPADYTNRRINISGLLPGMYFIKTGNIFEKFIKL